jgi:phage terminase large subunit GpA-like protein
MSYEVALNDILDSAEYKLSSLKPSEWAEQNIIMPKPFPGPLSYAKTPYTREIIDCFAPDHPAREIAIMGAAQFGKTASIIVPVIGWIIANDPGNIIMTVGHEDLVEEAMNKIDTMLDVTGLRKHIKPSAQRVRLQKTGDTNTKKEFPMGYLKLATANNPKIWRQADYKYGLIDDYEAVKSGTKIAGSTKTLIQKRFTAYNTTRKILYCSSPEREANSNILEVYLLGDQRKFFIPCPCCGVYIELKWSIEAKDKQQAGMTWQLDTEGKLIPESVGYTCQECLGFFTDKDKSTWVQLGEWRPTAKPFRPEYVSYYMPSWYSPHGMSDWEHYVYQWLECHPAGQKRDEGKYQSFLNLNAGEPYIESGEDISASKLQKNIRNYAINTIPEKMSIADGNGKIVLLTCACDLNGKLEDARLDYEVLAHSESGATYSITHGSIGTFIPNESGKKNKDTSREIWSYENHKQNSVWREFSKILSTVYETDTKLPTGKYRQMKIFISGVDTGYCELQAFTFIDNANHYVVGLKGDKEDKYVKYGIEMPNFKVGQSRNKLYLLRVGQIKDDLQSLINLKWDSDNDKLQPAGFMNFPTPSEGKYLLTNYFSHYESEQRILDKDNNFIWQKKTATAQNHLFDCRIYNLALRDIFLFEAAKEYKLKSFDWTEFCKIATGK